MAKTIFITGNSTGLGYGLTRAYLQSGDSVYGCSRHGCQGLEGNLYDYQCDLSHLEQIPTYLDQFIGQLDKLDLVILNAGILGDIKDLHETPLAEIQKTFDINVWANKMVLDWLHDQSFPIRQIVLMSSGAAVNGNRGWNGYALSKATLNMLTMQYAHEFTDTHLAAFAPGLVHTGMQDRLCTEIDTEKFPSIKALKNAIGTPAMPEPDVAGTIIAGALEQLTKYPSGSFVDIRKMNAPY
jgi:NAD(P)-dependent dehydrogenase (short-subunit alcohol dehydrogenase family)